MIKRESYLYISYSGWSHSIRAFSVDSFSTVSSLAVSGKAFRTYGKISAIVTNRYLNSIS